jgi:hypothetical protein
MSFTTIMWQYDQSEQVTPSAPITIERCQQQRGTVLYAVRQAGWCLSHSGEWTPDAPASRDGAFLTRCRFATWEQAAQAIETFCRDPRGRFAV